MILGFLLARRLRLVRMWRTLVIGSRLELRRLRHVRLLLWVQGLGLGSLLGLLLRWRLHVLLMVRHGFRRVFPAKPPAKVLSARRAALEHLSTPSQRAPWRPAQAASQVPWCSLGTAHKRAYQLLRQWSQHGSVSCATSLFVRRKDCSLLWQGRGTFPSCTRRPGNQPSPD